MRGTSAAEKSEWAPAPPPPDASLSITDAGAAFRTVFIGLVIAAIDIRVEGIDLLVDVIGFGMAARALLSLSDGALAIPDRARAAFRLAFAAAVVSAVFALGSFSVDESSFMIGELDNVDERAALAVLANFASSMALLTILWQLLSGIMIIATEQDKVALADNASKLRNRFAVAIIILILSISAVLMWDIDVNVGPVEFLIFLAVFVWLGFQLRSVTYTAAETLSLPSQSTPERSKRALLSPLNYLLLGLATVIAVLSLLYPPSSFVDTSNDDPFDFSDWFDTPEQSAGPSPVERALQRQTPTLVESPLELSAATEPGPSCPSLAATATAVSITSGETLWTQSIPSAVEPPALIGTSVLFTDPLVRWRLPNVSAIDVATGEIQWQRHVEAQQLTPWGAADGTATYRASDSWSYETSSRLLTLDEGGAIVNEEIADAPTLWSNQLESRFVPGGQTVKVSMDGDGSEPNLWLRRADGSLFPGDLVPFDETYTIFGNTSSLGDPIQIGDEIVLVVIGSHRGPNSRLVAYDGSSGKRLWEKEDLRSAAIATLDGRDVVVYDKRNSEPPDAASTRDLFVVEATDPDEVLWSAELTVNSDGGNGFLGSTEAGLIFATANEESNDDASPLEFTTITGELDAPDRLVAAESYGGGWTSRHLLAEDLIIASLDDEVTLLAADGTRSTIEFDQPVHHLARTGDTLLAVTSDLPDFCG